MRGRTSGPQAPQMRCHGPADEGGASHRWARLTQFVTKRRLRRAPAAFERNASQRAAPNATGFAHTLIDHETHLPTFEDPPRANPWLSCADEDARRSRGAQRAPRQRPQTPFIGLEPARSRGAAACMHGRPLRSADFDSVLATPAKARSAHFAAHHLAQAPQRHRKPGDTKLSTAHQDACTQPVDDVQVSPLMGRWFGVVVPKRHARHATTRNLLRRQIRGALARHQGALAPGIWLVRLRAPFDRAAFASPTSASLRCAARLELDRLLTRLAPAQ